MMHIARMNGMSTPFPTQCIYECLVWFGFYPVSFGVLSPYLIMIIIKTVKLAGQILEIKN